MLPVPFTVVPMSLAMQEPATNFHHTEKQRYLSNIRLEEFPLHSAIAELWWILRHSFKSSSRSAAESLPADCATSGQCEIEPRKAEDIAPVMLER